MPEQVPFINREDEFALIDKLIRDWDTLRILCIDAPGGIGKTRLLQEVRDRYRSREQIHLSITDIIDFDDRTCHVAENLGIRIGHMLDEKIFASFLRDMQDYRKMEMARVSEGRLTQGFVEGTQSFIECFNKLSDQKRVLLLFDTIEKFEETDYWEYLLDVFSQVKNSLIFMVGRNARNVGKLLQAQLSEDSVYIIDLQPLNEKAGEEYLQKKQELLHIELESELAQKLLLLSGGRPILIDLVAEWRARGISLNWLIKSSLEEMMSLPENEMENRQQEFERQLVLHIAKIDSQMDWLILLMSRVYPLDIEMMIATLRDISKEQAKKLFEEAKTYVFVKFLPDGRITLHDEMRRMIEDHVWPELDPEGHRRRHDSSLAAEYLKRKIQTHLKEIATLETHEKIAQEKDDLQAAYNAFLKQVDLEQEIWVLKQRHLRHTLLVDIDKGVKTFADAFDEATRSRQLNFREMLFITMREYANLLSSKQLYELNTRRVKNWLYKGHYSEAQRVITDILVEGNISPEQQVDMLILRANTEIRLGHVNKGISDFEKAVEISKANNLSLWHIKSLNGLGWAHLITGKVESATQHLREARHLYWDIIDRRRKKELQDDYGWISNNFAFVLSGNNKTRQTAISITRSTIEHWKSIGNDIGLGAGYLVLGIAYYRSAFFKEALETFQKALGIFEPLEFNDWLGQIYSWRGVVYEEMKKLDLAKRDLEKSLEIGSLNRKAMTLNRLGRVHMSQGKWDLAEENMKQSLESAQQIPDFLYWLASLGRLTTIAAVKGEYQRLDEFNQMLQDYFSKIKKEEAEKHPLGITYIGLAKLALGQNDMSKIETIVNFFKEGISLITEIGTYVRADILSRLTLVEKDFDVINPEIIHSVGKALQKYISEKESENVDYGIVTPVMYKWANWKREEVTNE